MSTQPYTQRHPVRGEFASEVSLPVRVAFLRHPDGSVEVTHVALESAAFGEAAGGLLWQRLAPRELQVLASEAEVAARLASRLDGEP